MTTKLNGPFVPGYEMTPRFEELVREEFARLRALKPKRWRRKAGEGYELIKQAREAARRRMAEELKP